MRGINALIAGEGGQRQGERLGGHCRQQTPPALPGAGPDEAVDVEPLVLTADLGGGALPFRGPHPPHHRQQAQPVFVLGPERDRRVGWRALTAATWAASPLF